MKGDRRVDKLRLAHFAVVRAGIRTARSSPDASHAEAWQHGQPTGTGLAQAQTPGASPRSTRAARHPHLSGPRLCVVRNLRSRRS